MAASTGPKESVIVGALIKHIRALPHPSWARKVHGSMYSDAGEPDIDAVILGVPLKVEVKRPGAPGATKLQLAALERWREAGAVVGVVHDRAELDELVIECLKRAKGD
jgi:hypothetical protein